MSDLRVLHVLASDLVGGTELLVAMVAEQMRRRDLDVAVATFDAPGPIAERLAGSGIRVWALGGAGLSVAARRLGGLLRRQKFDVIESYGFKTSVFARLCGRVLQPRAAQVVGVMGLHITEVVELDEFKGRFALAVERMLAPLADGYEVNSRGAMRLLSDHGVSQARMSYIPNAIEIGSWQPEPRRRSRSPIILCAARFVERKRQQDVINAAARLKDQGVSFRLLFAGEGPTRANCEQLVLARGLANQTEFLGAVSGDRMPAVMRGADLFVLASIWEGMPAVVLEAMASGLPVVGTDVNGVADLIEHGITGRLVPAKRPDAIADAIARVLEQPDSGRAMGAAGRRRVSEVHTLEAMVEGKLRLYERALERSARR